MVKTSKNNVNSIYLLRGFESNLSKFISLIIIVTIGTSFYTGMQSTGPSFRATAGNYYRNLGLHDFHISSPLGITEENVREIVDSGNFESISFSALDAQIEGTDLSIRIFPYFNDSGSIDNFKIREGREINSPDEILVDEIMKDKIKLGSIVHLNFEKSSEPLKENVFKVVGYVNSPMYIMGSSRGITRLGSGTLNGFAVVKKEQFQSEQVKEIILKDKELNQFEDNDKVYKEKSKMIKKKLEEKIKNLNSVENKNLSMPVIIFNKFREMAEMNLIAVEDRNNISEYTAFDQFSRQIEKVGLFAGGLFLIITALVSYTLMSRLIYDEKEQIATLKLMGYKNRYILWRYLLYLFIVSAIGVSLGSTLGKAFYPTLIFRIIKNLIFKELFIVSEFKYILISIFAVLPVIIIPMLFNLGKLLRNTPVNIMRYSMDERAEYIFLERWKKLWERIPFQTKITLRNIFRYKVRSLLLVTGILTCTGIVMTGFGIKDSAQKSIENQFDKVLKYDISAVYPAGEVPAEDIPEGNIENISQMDIIQKNFTAVGFSEDKINIQGIILDITSDYHSYYSLENVKGKNESLPLPENGALISRKLAENLHLKEGDTINLKNIEGKLFNIKISGIVKNYYNHHIIFSSEYYRNITGEETKFNTRLIKLKEKSPSEKSPSEKSLQEIVRMLKTQNDNGVYITTESIKLKSTESLKSMNAITLILVTVSGFMAFTVIYCLTTINIQERYKELATIKVLGMTDIKVGKYIFTELIGLTTAGIILGLPMGLASTRFILKFLEENNMFYIIYLKPSSVILSVFITLIFSLSVMVYYYFILKRIDMVESLKGMD